LTTYDHSQLTPRRLEDVVADGLEYPGWAEHYVRLGDRFDECFLLPPFGEETCRILVASEPDEWGEYPILVADVDDVPTLGLVYPGFDVYLASIARLPIPRRRDADVTWTTLFAVPPYDQRLTQHAQHLFGGPREVLADAQRPEGYEWLALDDEGAEAEQRLQCPLPEELLQLYSLADGFAVGAYVLRDGYRLLPLDEMIEASLALVGEPVVLDALAGEYSQVQRVIRLVFGQAQEDDPDIVQVSVRLWHRKWPSVEVWYRAGGIYDFEEVVDTQDSLTAWLEACLEYYL
jgi:hypothetical protein